jgi:putative hydrolase of the HAD superfamily
MISTLLLDAGGTLVFPNFRRIADELSRDGIDVTPERLAACEPHARFAIDQSDLVARTRDDSRWNDYFEEIARASGLPGMSEGALARLRAYHQANNLWELVDDDMPVVLAELGTKYRLAVVSNSNGTVAKKLARLGLADAFELIIDSGDEGIEKPDPAIFVLALNRLGITAEEAAYVGDIYHVDIVGARAAGIYPVLLDPAGLHSDKDCVRIRSLRELLTRNL